MEKKAGPNNTIFNFAVNRIIAWTALCFLSVSCGTKSSSDAPGPSTTPTPVSNPSTALPTANAVLSTSPLAGKGSALLILAGGYGSCGNFQTVNENYMANALQSQTSALKANGSTVTAYALSCFGTDGSQVAYALSSNPNQLQRASVTQYVDTVRSLAQSVGTTRVYVTGHSYGGWLAMQIGLSLQSIAIPRILTTLDPISTQTCQPANFVKYFLGALQGIDISQGNPGCDQSPSDFDATKRVSLAAIFPIWNNYFQTAFAPLHSSAIPQATTNEQMPYAPGLIGNAHDRVGKDPDLTSRIAAAIALDAQK